VTVLSKYIWQTLGLGLAAGIRSMSAPAFAAYILQNQQQIKSLPLNLLQHPAAGTTFKVLAIAELIGDKAPQAPNRTSAPALGARILMGALCGSAIFKAHDDNATLGALIGGSTALLSTFVTFYLRRNTVKLAQIPDAVYAVAEDAAVLSLGYAISR
jgi:uncharacterized membrane protein